MTNAPERPSLASVDPAARTGTPDGLAKDGRASEGLNGEAGSAEAETLATHIKAGDRRAVAKALNLLDDRRPFATRASAALLERLAKASVDVPGQLLGLTGPPGVGKSTLISSLIRAWRRLNLTVGVLAADPSSPLSGGALLGDRLRMHVDANDEQVFIRSLASRGTYGGLSSELLPMAVVMLTAFDRVIVETVGVGQREVDVAYTTDLTCLAVQPGAGDSIQFLKSGVMEVPDVLLVTKADLGPLAGQTHAELRACVDGRGIPVVSTSGATSEGVDALIDAIDSVHGTLSSTDALRERREAAQIHWLIARLRDEFGSYGLASIGGEAAIIRAAHAAAGSPLTERAHFRRAIVDSITSTGGPTGCAAMSENPKTFYSEP